MFLCRSYTRTGPTTPPTETSRTCRHHFCTRHSSHNESESPDRARCIGSLARLLPSAGLLSHDTPGERHSESSSRGQSGCSRPPVLDTVHNENTQATRRWILRAQDNHGKTVAIPSPLADQLPVDIVKEEEPLQLRSRRLLNEPPVRLGLLIAQKLHRHGRTVVRTRPRPAPFRRIPSVLADLDRSHR